MTATTDLLPGKPPPYFPSVPNVPLMTATLTHIETHPEEWDQGDWRSRCGTACCFAGRAVLLHGGQFAVRASGRVSPIRVVPPGADPADESQWRCVAEYAAEILGIDGPDAFDDHAVPLFSPYNDLDDLRRMVADFVQDVRERMESVIRQTLNNQLDEAESERRMLLLAPAAPAAIEARYAQWESLAEAIVLEGQGAGRAQVEEALDVLLREVAS